MMLTLALILYMAAAYRYRGGWKPIPGVDSPRAIELLSVSWPMAWVAFDSSAGQPMLYRVGLALLVLLLTTAAHSIGHGNAMTLGRRPYTGDERREPWDAIAGPLLVGANYGYRWKRDAIALTLSGVVVGFPPALALGLAGRPLAAAVWLFAGAAKTAAYELGWRLRKEGSRWRQGTEIGEAGFGAILGLAVAATLL